jgi:hypothetical protein
VGYFRWKSFSASTGNGDRRAAPRPTADGGSTGPPSKVGASIEMAVWLGAGAQLARCLRPVGRSIAMASWCGSPVGKHGRTPADGQGPCEVGGKDGGKQVWMTRRRVLEQPFP